MACGYGYVKSSLQACDCAAENLALLNELPETVDVFMPPALLRRVSGVAR